MTSRTVVARYEVTLTTTVEVDVDLGMNTADSERAAIEAAAAYVFENDVAFDTARVFHVGWAYSSSGVLEDDPDGRRSRNLGDEVLGDL